jgi:hypothetical protein
MLGTEMVPLPLIVPEFRVMFELAEESVPDTESEAKALLKAIELSRFTVMPAGIIIASAPLIEVPGAIPPAHVAELDQLPFNIAVNVAAFVVSESTANTAVTISALILECKLGIIRMGFNGYVVLLSNKLLKPLYLIHRRYGNC